VQENVLAGVRKEGKSGMYYVCTTVVGGYNFLHTRRVSVWMKVLGEESACPLGKKGYI
jgi:hypothetical protein